MAAERVTCWSGRHRRPEAPICGLRSLISKCWWNHSLPKNNGVIILPEGAANWSLCNGVSTGSSAPSGGEGATHTSVRNGTILSSIQNVMRRITDLVCYSWHTFLVIPSMEKYLTSIKQIKLWLRRVGLRYLDAVIEWLKTSFANIPFGISHMPLREQKSIDSINTRLRHTLIHTLLCCLRGCWDWSLQHMFCICHMFFKMWDGLLFICNKLSPISKVDK